MTKFESCPKLKGIVPFKELNEISKYCNNEKLAIEFGSEPHNLLKERSKVLRFSNVPNEFGISPTNPLLDKSKDSKLFRVQFEKLSKNSSSLS